MRKVVRFSVMLVAAMVAAVGVAGMWEGLEEANHCGGARIDEDALEGKVVMFYEWSAADPESVEGLKTAEKYWQGFKTKPFAVVGSHSGGSGKREGVRSESHVSEL